MKMNLKNSKNSFYIFSCYNYFLFVNEVFARFSVSFTKTGIARMTSSPGIFFFLSNRALHLAFASGSSKMIQIKGF